MIRATDLTVVSFSDDATLRLIPTAYVDEPAMAPLADDDAALSILEEIEGLTSARQSANLPVPGGVDPRELLTEAAGYGWTLVNAAFCYTRETGNRFNGSERGAWYAAYGSDATATAQAEVGWHLTQELRATGVFQNITSYREVWAGFTSRFHHLSEPVEPICNPDPAIAYPQGQALARDILSEGGNGLLYPSTRRRNGRCLVALRPNLVQNIRQGGRWNFVWDGNPDPDIRPMLQPSRNVSGSAK